MILILLAVLVLVVAMAPTIASTGPVRSFVVGRVNDSLNGRVTISDWSLGWLSGIKVFGVKVYDDRNTEILDAPRITTQLTLLDAARGKFNLGDTQIEIANLVARIDESGKSNFEKLPKAPGKPAASKAESNGELPSVSGKVTVNFRGTVEAAGLQTVHIDPSTAVINIPDINKPIADDVKLAFHVGEETPGTVTLAGTVDAVQNNKLDLDQLAADQKINIANVNLAAAGPFLKQAKVDAQLGGVANGAIHASAPNGIAGISTDGEIVVSDLLVGGGMLKGDTFKSDRLTIPLQITRTVVDPNTTVIKIEQLGVQMPEANMSVTGQVTQEALMRLKDQQPPGADGKIDYVLNVPDVSKIANQLPHTLGLAQGVTLNGGSFSQTSSIVLTKDQLAFNQRVDFAASGTRNGQPIALAPIHAETDAQVIPTPGAAIPDFRNIKLVVQSEFARVTGGGASIANLKLDGGFDLDKLSRELRQFTDMGQVQLAGTGTFSVATAGDIAKVQEGQPIDASISANFANVNVTGIQAQPPVNVARLAFDTKAQMTGTKTNVIDTVDVQRLTFQTGPQDAPVVDVAASATVNVPTMSRQGSHCRNSTSPASPRRSSSLARSCRRWRSRTWSCATARSR